MLMIARGQTVYPTASYNADWQKWSWLPTWAQKDEDGYETFRPYHRIVIDNRACTEQCLNGDNVCEDNCEMVKSNGDIFKGVVKNVNFFHGESVKRKLESEVFFHAAVSGTGWE